MEDRDYGERLWHGLVGAFLAALSGLSCYVWIGDGLLWVIGVLAALGFFGGWMFGDEAIEFFKQLFRWL